ncbi:MAG TPA: DUF4089 domain-containing protein [Stellaceae bacterium]|nr:DUF4089 domain-containing protein [Stellaceae bacterium]
MAPPIPIMTDTERAQALDAELAVLGLTIEEGWREGVLTHVRMIGDAARLVLEFPLGDEIEAAPIFIP